MARYRKKPAQKHDQPRLVQGPELLLGMLYIADVVTTNLALNETTRHRILLVGCEAADIERKLRWIFDSTKFDSFRIEGVEKVREKVHVLSTVVKQAGNAPSKVMDREGRQQPVVDPPRNIERQRLNLYAVGITTTVSATDETHAIRKAGNAIANSASGLSHSGPSLSEDSTVQVEQIPWPSGYARPRDVSAEVNPAHFVRG